MAETKAEQNTSDTRRCTCHPSDNPPVPCPQKYALTECRLSATIAQQRQEIERLKQSRNAYEDLYEVRARQVEALKRERDEALKERDKTWDQLHRHHETLTRQSELVRQLEAGNAALRARCDEQGRVIGTIYEAALHLIRFAKETPGGDEALRKWDRDRP